MRNRFGRTILIFAILIGTYGCTNVKENKKAEYTLLKGVNLSQQGDFEGALREYKASYGLNPKNVILLKEMAFVYYKFSEYDKAEELWLKALEIAPDDEEIIKNLAVLYFEKGDYDKTNAIIEKSCNKKSDYYMKIKGLMALNENNTERAFKIFENMNINSFDTDTYIKFLNISKRYYDKNQQYKMLKTGELLFAKDKEYALFYGQTLGIDLKMYDEAEKVLLNYIINNGNDDNIILLLSKIYKNSGKEEKAKDVLLLLTDKNILL